MKYQQVEYSEDAFVNVEFNVVCTSNEQQETRDCPYEPAEFEIHDLGFSDEEPDNSIFREYVSTVRALKINCEKNGLQESAKQAQLLLDNFWYRIEELCDDEPEEDSMDPPDMEREDFPQYCGER